MNIETAKLVSMIVGLLTIAERLFSYGKSTVLFLKNV